MLTALRTIGLLLTAIVLAVYFILWLWSRFNRRGRVLWRIMRSSRHKFIGLWLIAGGLIAHDLWVLFHGIALGNRDNAETYEKKVLEQDKRRREIIEKYKEKWDKKYR